MVLCFHYVNCLKLLINVLQGVQYTETDGVCEKEALGAYPGRCVPGIITVIFWKAINNQWLCLRGKMERDRFEWVLWQMPLYQQEIKKKSAQKTHQTVQLHNDCGST